MNSGYYAACTGLVSRAEALDTIANNLANSSTTGFRAHHNVFSSVLAATNQDSLSLLNQDVNDYGILSGTRMDGTQGTFSKTGNDLDVAIEGPGYFAVQTSAGVKYTRSGNFRISPNGQLTTAAGDMVLGDNGPITLVGMPITIGANGTISVDGAVAGHLSVVEFDAATALKNDGGMYTTAPAGTAKVATSSSVRQGMLENSNTNPMTSVVELIAAQREVETMRRVLTVFNSEMDKTASQDIPRVS
ncbi:MAG: flagellar hook basal-body protein [Acidobacteriaceae bacterium]|nr:flagellar hook basal-body protein [Acidobacteriaceae bacterium]